MRKIRPNGIEDEV
ncbi:hypothetical protein D032_4899A, partial [Vibrio parahaemolyticus V14/01]